MRTEHRKKSSRKDFELYGIIGYPLRHTLSPQMQEAGFEGIARKAFYCPYEISPEKFARSLMNLKKWPVEGLNVTVPFKEKVIRFLDHVRPEARAIGAVNTVFRQGSRWIGANTDADGFLTMLRQDCKLSLRGKKFLVFGAGGSSRAVLYGLASSGAKQIDVVNRTAPKAQKIVREIGVLFPKVRMTAHPMKRETLKNWIDTADVVINTTSVGLRPGECFLQTRDIRKASPKQRKYFVDLIYKPAETLFLKRAKQKGHHAANGLGMLLYQGVRSFELWTRKKAPVSKMRNALIQGLSL